MLRGKFAVHALQICASCSFVLSACSKDWHVGASGCVTKFKRKRIDVYGSALPRSVSDGQCRLVLRFRDIWARKMALDRRKFNVGGIINLPGSLASLWSTPRWQSVASFFPGIEQRQCLHHQCSAPAVVHAARRNSLSLKEMNGLSSRWGNTVD